MAEGFGNYMGDEEVEKHHDDLTDRPFCSHLFSASISIFSTPSSRKKWVGRGIKNLL